MLQAENFRNPSKFPWPVAQRPHIFSCLSHNGVRLSHFTSTYSFLHHGLIFLSQFPSLSIHNGGGIITLKFSRKHGRKPSFFFTVCSNMKFRFHYEICKVMFLEYLTCGSNLYKILTNTIIFLESSDASK